MPAIDIQNLCFRYTEDASSFSLTIDQFQVSSGGRVVLFGPSGCGKSTLLQLIAGELVAQRGKVSVLSTELSQLSDQQRRSFRIHNIGFVFQDFPLVEYLSAFENVLLPYRINPALKLTDLAQDRARELLTDLGLGGKEQRLPRHLSQGERQRVAIARALVVNPKIVLADEPTAGLDMDRSMAVMDILDRVVADRGVTLIVVTHDPAVRGRFQQTLDLGAIEA